jgi:hypothetical protein
MRHRRKERTYPIRLSKLNMVSPLFSRKGRQPQGAPTEWRVKEDGKSESRSVMERIGVEPTGNITLRRKHADFHRVSKHERV